jgi:hypothetical protein
MNNKNTDALLRLLTAIQWVAGIIIFFHIIALFLLLGSGHIISERKELLFFRNIIFLLGLIISILFIKNRIRK